MRLSRELLSEMKQIFFQCQILEAYMLGLHSLFVERISKLFPKYIIILTEEMEVHGYEKNILYFSKSHQSSYQGLTGPC